MVSRAAQSGPGQPGPRLFVAGNRSIVRTPGCGVAEGLTSADLKIREDTFYALIMPARRIANTTSSAVAMRYLLRTHPDEAEQLKAAMISALELANGYVRDLEKKNAHSDEYFSDYRADLVWVVASLRDPRALEGLLAVIDTGGLAVNGLADLGPIAVDAVIKGF